MVNETPEEKQNQTPESEATPEPETQQTESAESAPVEESVSQEAGNQETGSAEETPAAQPPASGFAEQSGTSGTAEEGGVESGETASGSSEGAMPELTLGGGATAVAEEGEEEEKPAPKIRGKIDKQGVAIGTGRRKTSVARVRIRDGNGQLLINGRSLDVYFRIERDQKMIEAPLKATETYGSVDVWVRVQGGGTTGQTGAIILGIARALEARNPNLHHTLSEGGFLTRDDRMVERKKYGFKKARKSFQFSKR